LIEFNFRTVYYARLFVCENAKSSIAASKIDAIAPSFCKAPKQGVGPHKRVLFSTDGQILCDLRPHDDAVADGDRVRSPGVRWPSLSDNASMGN